MGHQTIKRVPSHVHTYARAKQIHDESKPIRGRSPEIRPLGNRRDCDTYHVRMNGDAVEFVLYKTPVVTYHPDDTIELRTGGWQSLSTRQMFSHVLGIGANGHGNKTVLTVRKDKFVMGDEPIKMKWMGAVAGLCVLDAPLTYGYQLNRKKMNEVRRQYLGFIKYMKAFVSLRESTVTLTRFGQDYGQTEIAWTVGEAADCLGTKWAVPNGQVNMANVYVCNLEWVDIDRLPTELVWRNTTWENYNAQSVKFFDLCRDGQAEETKHSNFHKAMMVMLTNGQGYIRAGEGDLTEVRVTRSIDYVKAFELLMKKFHRKEILESVHLTDGRVPNTTYEKWMKEDKK